MDVLQLLCFWCVSGSKAPLTCVWDEEQFYTAGPVPQNDVSGLVDGKPWISMPLNQDGFTMLNHLTFLAFGFSTCTFDANNQLATHIICTERALHHG